MPIQSLDRPFTTRHLYELVRTRYLTPDKAEQAMRTLNLLPDEMAWRQFLDNALIALGITFLLSGIIFFFAYNWADMSRFTKFGILEAGLLLACLIAVTRDLSRLPSKFAILAAAILVGILLAVYGQIYQTGADAYSLFLAWAVMILPWVILSTFAPLWFIWLILLNLSLWLYWEQVYSHHFVFDTTIYALLAALNGSALIVWEYAYQRNIIWLRGKWFATLLYMATLTNLLIPTWIVILKSRQLEAFEMLAAILYVLTTLISFGYYYSQRRDLLLLTINLAGLIATSTIIIGRAILSQDVGSWLILSIWIIGTTAAAGSWLLKTARTGQQELTND